MRWHRQTDALRLQLKLVKPLYVESFTCNSDFVVEPALVHLFLHQLPDTIFKLHDHLLHARALAFYSLACELQLGLELLGVFQTHQIPQPHCNFVLAPPLRFDSLYQCKCLIHRVVGELLPLGLVNRLLQLVQASLQLLAVLVDLACKTRPWSAGLLLIVVLIFLGVSSTQLSQLCRADRQSLGRFISLANQALQLDLHGFHPLSFYLLL
mmetsp:Transcript_53980/g.94727  ORF Transcript_53980/g.94727 Transcript_53980/m.94727 type:complete len:210 (-) Transcript_53980:378-1007(-)